jgi:hypothetical protein
VLQWHLKALNIQFIIAPSFLPSFLPSFVHQRYCTAQPSSVQTHPHPFRSIDSSFAKNRARKPNPLLSSQARPARTQAQNRHHQTNEYHIVSCVSSESTQAYKQPTGRQSSSTSSTIIVQKRRISHAPPLVLLNSAGPNIHSHTSLRRFLALTKFLPRFRVRINKLPP